MNSRCPWEKIEGFISPGEFKRFERWMADQIEAGSAEEIPVDGESRDFYWRQRWFRHIGSDTVWRLADPDPPFAGVFKPVARP